MYLILFKILMLFAIVSLLYWRIWSIDKANRIYNKRKENRIKEKNRLHKSWSIEDIEQIVKYWN